jgi:RNA polymerase sigma factor (sigma-70 family)
MQRLQTSRRISSCGLGRNIDLEYRKRLRGRLPTLKSRPSRVCSRMPGAGNWVPLSMSQDPENGKSEQAAFQAGARSNALGGTSGVANTSSSNPRLLTDFQVLVDGLFAESGGHSWGLTRDRFEVALEASASKHFGALPPAPQKLEEYLGALHLNDLALACSCAQGCTEAWEHFVASYRGYLRAAAGAVLRCSATSPAACELADSLFAELYGLSEGKRADRSLFRYFHGRSSLKTWLRAILAQRHVDAIRAGRRFTELDEDDRSGRGATRNPASAKHIESPPDPHRERYVALFACAMESTLAQLDARDRDRLRLYYADEKTLAEIGRTLGEHESSVSRNLERIRRDLRRAVEEVLRKGRVAANGSSSEPGLSEEEISLCLEYASEDAPIDLDKLFSRSGKPAPKSTRPQR